MFAQTQIRSSDVKGNVCVCACMRCMCVCYMNFHSGGQGGEGEKDFFRKEF